MKNLQVLVAISSPFEVSINTSQVLVSDLDLILVDSDWKQNEQALGFSCNLMFMCSIYENKPHFG